MASEEVFDPLTRYQCCPPTCGAAAAVLCSDDFAKKHGISQPGVDRRAGDDDRLPSSFEKSMIKMVGYDMTVNAAQEGLRAGGPRPAGRAGLRAARLLLGQRDPHVRGRWASARRARPRSSSGTGGNTYGGKVVTNPSGGLLSKGHPLGATGLAQCTELVWQLRGQADKRQVPNAKVALQHNLGLGGACVVTMYRRD